MGACCSRYVELKYDLKEGSACRHDVVFTRFTVSVHDGGSLSWNVFHVHRADGEKSYCAASESFTLKRFCDGLGSEVYARILEDARQVAKRLGWPHP